MPEIAEAPSPSNDAAKAVATAPPVHADDSGDRPLGDFGSDNPNDNPQADIKVPKFLPPKRGTIPQPPVKTSEETDKPVKTEEVVADKTPDKTAEKTGEQSKEPNYEKMAPKELREAVKRFHKQNRELEKKLSEFKSKSTPPVDDPEKKVFQEKLTAAEKRVAELMEDLKFSDFEKHPDYAEKYEKPFLNAYNAGRSHVAKISVNMPDGTTRRGTAEDFDSIVKLAMMDYDAAATKAEEMFGPVKAATVLQHLNRAQELNDVRNSAAAEWKTKGNEREKIRSEERDRFHKQVSEEIKSLWTEHVEGAIKKYSQWSSPIEGDIEGNAKLEEGYNLVNEGFSTLAAPALNNPNLSKQERSRLVEIHAKIRNGAAWFPRVELQNKQLRNEVKSLKAKLSEYESSVPKGGDGGRGGVPIEDEGDQSIAAFLKNGSGR